MIKTKKIKIEHKSKGRKHRANRERSIGRFYNTEMDEIKSQRRPTKTLRRSSKYFTRGMSTVGKIENRYETMNESK